MKLKNILGTLETPETTREHSRLFPEAPSSRALEIVGKPEWQTAITFRLNEAMYGANMKTLYEVVFPKIPRIIPTYDSEINFHLFTEEEAVRLDRRATQLIDEEKGFTRDDAYGSIVKDGPPDQESIRVEERFRRLLLNLTDSIEKSEWDDCDIIRDGIQDTIAKFKDEQHEHIALVFVCDVVDSLFGAHLKKAVALHDAKKTLGMLRAISTTRFAQLSHHAETIQAITRDGHLMECLARLLLEKIDSPQYADQLRACGQYGLDIGVLKERIRNTCFFELMMILETGDEEKFFRNCDFAARQEIVTEEELSQNSGMRAAIPAHARSLLKDEKRFRSFQKKCNQTKIFESSKLATHPLIQKAADDLLVESFHGRNGIPRLLEAASKVARMGIFTYDEALNRPSIIELAARTLEEVFTNNAFTDDPKQQEDIYLATVFKYTSAKIGSRDFFDHFPAIEKARKNAKKS